MIGVIFGSWRRLVTVGWRAMDGMTVGIVGCVVVRGMVVRFIRFFISKKINLSSCKKFLKF